ncbi:MAG: transposase [Lachnospiraceae bacterium]|nr:transposase [Lachnospiraceae bacterium]
MRVTSGYKAEILKLKRPLERTLKISRSAAAWLLPVIGGEWEKLSEYKGEKKRFNEAEKLIHTTKGNEARYPFDEAFPKMPSYLRRAVLQHVIGLVSSAETRKASEKAGAPGERHRASKTQDHWMPVFYKDNMYRKEEDRVYLKLWNGKDWGWQEVRLKKTDLDYLRKYWSDVKAKSPVLVKQHKKYFLQFSFEEAVTLREVPVGKRRICAVDLGINTDAVCSIMTGDGTVAARKFIGFAAEKDRQWRVLNRVRKKQREHGPESVRGMYAYARRLGEEAARKTASAIVAFAEEQHADVIVFEHLEMRGKIRGKSRQKLHMWKKSSVQKITEHKAHRLGMRVSRVCAWNTSALAYDGSGKVERDAGNRSLAVFANWKQYNSDLSASYNIGARYFIREYIKPVPETERSALEAKVPAVRRRTSCVYADLLALIKVMGESA